MSNLVKTLEAKISTEMETKHYAAWERQARYMGNKVYQNTVTRQFSTDTRELMLMYIATMEKIDD
jgi:hypothetical protein